MNALSLQARRARLLLALALAAIALLPAASRAQAKDRQQWQQPDRVMRDLHLEPGIRVADVGCGTGYFTFRLARAVGPGGYVLAHDVSAGALESIRNRCRAERLTNVEVAPSRPTSCPAPDGSLDAAFFCNVHHEMSPPDRQPLMLDVARALKPGGTLFLIDLRKSREVTFDPYEKLVPRDELLRLATDAGLVLDAEFHYLQYQVFLRFRKPDAQREAR